MTKLISILIIVVLLYCSWRFYLYWDRVKNEQENAKQQAAAALSISPESLPGMPYELAPSLQAAQKAGAQGLRAWLKQYGSQIYDPRKAWIELDFCVAVSQESPAEARRVFGEVKRRTPPASPVWPRIQQLSETYE